MTDSNHNNPVLSYDELGFIIGMKRVEKKVSTIDSNIEKIMIFLRKALKSKKHSLLSLSQNLLNFKRCLMLSIIDQL